MYNLITTVNKNVNGFHLQEILECITYNSKLSFIKKIIILFDIESLDESYYKEIENIENMEEKISNILSSFTILLKNEKIVFKIVKNHPTYQDIFVYTNKFVDTHWILCNSDIFYPVENLHAFNYIFKNIDFEKKMICLTRYDYILKDIHHHTKYYDGYLFYYKNSKLKTRRTNGCSIDTWIYKTPIILDNYNIKLGIQSCDGIMNCLLSKHYELINPCFDLISIHKHVNHDKKWSNKQTANAKMLYELGYRIKNVKFSKLIKNKKNIVLDKKIHNNTKNIRL